MDKLLLVAAALAILLGVGHSYLGERYVLMRLFRRTELPKLFGSDVFTRRVLRFAWHLTSVAWWGFAAILVILASGDPARFRENTLLVLAVTFGIHAAITAGFSRGRHLAWIPFLAITVICWLAR